MNQQIRQQVTTEVPSPRKGGLWPGPLSNSCASEIWGGIQNCPVDPTLPYHAGLWKIIYLCQPNLGRHASHLILYQAVTQMEDNQQHSRPTASQKWLSKSIVCCWPWQEVKSKGRSLLQDLLSDAVTPTVADMSCTDASFYASHGTSGYH